jgi:hypothetical protein
MLKLLRLQLVHIARQHAIDTATRVVVPLIHYHEADAGPNGRDAPTYHAVAPVETVETASKGKDEQLASTMELPGGAHGGEVDTTPKRIRHGSVQVLFSLANMQTRIRHTFLTGVALTLSIIIVGVLLSFLFVGYMLTPIQAMARRRATLLAAICHNA